MRRSVLLGSTVAAAFIAAACGSNPYASTPTATSTSTDSSGAYAPTPAPAAATPGAAAPGAITLMVANSSLGQILVDSQGRTLYLWAVDKGSTSSCYASCGSAWPPVLTTGMPLAGTGVNPSLLGTSTRTDGRLEVVYNGHPLYYFIADKKPGDTTGQGLNNFGGPWYVVAPSGNKIDND